MRLCGKCGERPARDGEGDCLLCHAAGMRAFRKTHALTKEQRRRSNCRAYTRMLVKRGKIIPQPCWCGKKAERHHPDYSNPRLVEWLCKKHHRAEHRRMFHEEKSHNVLTLT